MRILLATSLLASLIACSRPCNPVEGQWTGEFWGDDLEGTLELEFETDPSDRTLAHIGGIWQDAASPEAENNLYGSYSCPGDGAILGLFLYWELDGDEGTEQVYGQLYGDFGTNREGDGTWDADWWAGPTLFGEYEGDWTARQN
ncbi:MAG: hypothetical protein GY913_07735 [Proteobacteria bacterium]|nr:hypothetical protein [Pseudomonadota bacterium]MCP4916802.1 hypothetical protein [Pseudomonadota bacterium]